MQVLILGHIDLTVEEFNNVYAPDIKKFVNEYSSYKPTFYLEEHILTHGKEYIEKLGYEVKTYSEEYSLSNYNAFILFLRNKVSSLSSPTMHKFITKCSFSSSADRFVKHVNSKEWDSVNECLEAYELDSYIKLSIPKILVL